MNLLLLWSLMQRWLLGVRPLVLRCTPVFLAVLLSLVAWEHAEPDGPLFSQALDQVVVIKSKDTPHHSFSEVPLAGPPPLPVQNGGAVRAVPHPSTAPALTAFHLGLDWLCRRQVEGN